MSTKEYKSFHEETQTKFKIECLGFTPNGFPAPGMYYRLTEIRTHEKCPECGHSTYVHEYKTRVVSGGVYLGAPVYYEIKSIRYECSVCEATFMRGYEYLPSGGTVTIETENYIIYSLGGKTFSTLAEETGLCVQSIADRAAAFGKDELEVMLSGRYKYLSMDEVYIGRDDENHHVVYWVLNDISAPWKSNNVMVSNRGRSEGEVTECLLRLKHPESVEAVCIDMWQPYVNAVLRVLPNAMLVIDRFHLIKAAQECVNAARRSLDAPKKVKDAMKKDADLFLCSMDKLTQSQWRTLEGYLGMDAKLEYTYFFAQELMELYYVRGYEEALDYLCEWEGRVHRSGIDLPIYYTVCNWLPYILNYFLHHVSNGKTEGKNNLIRQIDRMGFHYGIECFQGCLYAHDRKQEYVKWRRYLRKKTIGDRTAKKARVIEAIQSLRRAA